MPENSTSAVVALVGSETLLGRELREVLGERKLPARIQMVGGVSDAGVLTEEEGEAAVIAPLAEEHLADAAVVLLAGSPASSRKAARIAAERVLIDGTYALEDRPTARLRAPSLEAEGFRTRPGTIHILAHPAAVVVATLLDRIQRAHPIRHSVVQVFEPASERGQRGLDELQQQSIALLSFRTVPQEFFDAQVAFNLLPRYGAEAMEPLEEAEARIGRHLATLLANAAPGQPPLPSLRLSHAPVFHGYTMSLWIELADAAPDPGTITALLRAAGIDVRSGDETPPSNVGAAGQSGIAAGGIEADANHPRAFWMWVAADNLRVSADAAYEVARQQLAESGHAGR